MILIAPDKYRGTITSHDACRIIAEAAGDRLDTLCVPMADGGEGTAACIGADTGWLNMGRYRVNDLTSEAVVDSAAVIGHEAFHGVPPEKRTSEALGSVVNEIWQRHRPTRLYIGVGGTGCCDGGEGFLRTIDRAAVSVLVGLIDVQVPLLPAFPGGPSALMFAPQKGFTPERIPSLVSKLERVVRHYGPAVSPYDGAGGGLGYALASVLGIECHSGAEWILDRAHIDWESIALAVTGEGRYDAQSLCGKVVDAVSRRAKAHGIPTVILAGSVDSAAKNNDDSIHIVDCSDYEANRELTPDLARERLILAAKDIFCNI